MEHRKKRRIPAYIGVFLLVISAGVFVSLRGGILERPFVAVQASALGAAGVFDIIAGFDSPVTERFEWYRLSGLGNISLAVSLPLGFLSPLQPVLFSVVALCSLPLAMMGADMIALEGRHVYSEPLGKTSGDSEAG